MQSRQTKYGVCKFYGKDTFIGRSIYNYGEWSGLECEKIISLASGRCVDVGANIGFMSMALAHSGFAVEAFEPQPELYKLLVENVPNATCHNVALSREKGTAIMPRIRYGSVGNYGGLGIGTRSELGSIDVRVETLDSYSYKDVGLIKIDVEGHELGVLQGAVETIRRCRPILYVEDDREDKRYDLHKFIRSLGYTIEAHNPPMYRPDNFAGLHRNIWDIDYISMNIICRPC